MVTFAHNIKDITRAIETAQTNLEQSKIDGLKELANKAFTQVETKYIVPGNYAKPSKSGKTLQYLTPPGANIFRKQTLYNAKTKFKKIIQIPLFVLGKIVSRSGTYQNQINQLSTFNFQNGSNVVQDVRVEISKDSVKVFADSESEFFKIETHKQLGKTPLIPVTKAFRSIVNLWKSVRLKLGK